MLREKVLFILGELDDDDIDWMLEVGQHRTLPAGHVLIQERRLIDAFYILLDGELSVSTLGTGQEIATLAPGEVVGEMSFIDTRSPSATVTAKRDSLVLVVSRSHLMTKLRQDVGFAARFYRALAVFLSNRLRLTMSQLGQTIDGFYEVLSDDELAREAHENMAIAQTRLDWLLRRLRDDF